MKPKALGKNQSHWLQTVADWRGKTWYHGCGVIWENRSSSIQLCESLVARGLMERVDDRPTYRVTKAGIKVVKTLSPANPPPSRKKT